MASPIQGQCSSARPIAQSNLMSRKKPLSLRSQSLISTQLWNHLHLTQSRRNPHRVWEQTFPRSLHEPHWVCLRRLPRVVLPPLPGDREGQGRTVALVNSPTPIPNLTPSHSWTANLRSLNTTSSPLAQGLNNLLQ